MAILGFHFSGVYKDALFKGTKTATVLAGEYFFKKGQEVLVYLSNKPNLLQGKIEKRIGKAKIQKVKIKRVQELTPEEAKFCGYKNLLELKKDLKKWYKAQNNLRITYIKFALKLEK